MAQTRSQTILQGALTTLGAIGALGLLSASIASNFQFGMLLADGPLAWVYAGAGGFADALKTVLPFVVAGAFAAGWFGRGLVAGAMLALVVLYSLSCAVGLYAIAKDERLGDVAATRAAHERLTDQKQDIEDRLNELDADRAPGAIEAEIAKLKLDHKFDRSRQCENATVHSSIKLCQRIETAEGKLADAEKATALRQRLQPLEARLAGIDLQDVLSRADPAAAAVSRLTGTDADTVRDALAVTVAVLIEAGSSLGFWLVGGMWAGGGRRKDANEADIAHTSPPEGDAQPAERWAEHVIREQGATTTAAALREHHERWAALQGVEPLSQTALGRHLSDLGVKREKVGGKTRYTGVRLAAIEAGPRLVRSA